MNVKEFIKLEKPIIRSSKLDQYRSDILELYTLGYNLNQILHFLELNNLEISKPALQRFIKTRLMNETGAQVRNKTFQKESVKQESNISSQKIKNDDEVAKRPSWASKTPMSELI